MKSYSSLPHFVGGRYHTGNLLQIVGDANSLEYVPGSGLNAKTSKGGFDRLISRFIDIQMPFVCLDIWKLAIAQANVKLLRFRIANHWINATELDKNS